MIEKLISYIAYIQSFSKVFSLGRPHEMSQEEMDSATAEAEVLLVEEDERARRPARDTMSVMQATGVLSDADIQCLKDSFPVLAEFSDDFLRSTPRGDLMKIQSTAHKLKESERVKDADDKLAANKAAMATKFTKLLEGKDNRSSSLHQGRFLGGAGCSSTRLWLTARSMMDKSGFPAIGNYDMGSVGMAGHVSARGWVEVHNPQSSRLSIKMFSIGNCSSRAGSRSDSVKESHADDTLEIGEFKLALRAMRLAVHFTMPWNFSIEALEGFFLLSNFCSTDLANVERKGQLLTVFTDYILTQNAERWRDSEPFLTTGELKTAWGSFFQSRPQSAISKQPKKPQAKPGNPANDVRKSLNICFAYNYGTCKNTANDCTTLRGTKLRHICDFTPDAAKPAIVCGKDHPKKGNH